MDERATQRVVRLLATIEPELRQRVSELLAEPVAGRVSIGGASVALVNPKDWFSVPDGIGKALPPTEEILRHLKWMIEKDNLGQDMFLIGPPGPVRRWLASKYCALTQREAEFVSLSRDTTESDLKQRREIINGTLVYKDQPAVEAAIEGHILVLEGLEKCERNVLPVLNNLLENREMSLDDGRFLMSGARYAELLKSEGQEALDRLRIVPVSPRFRVIALGLPTPTFIGHPLDPPLRSRFQARNVPPLSIDTLFALLSIAAPTLDKNVMRQLVVAVAGLQGARAAVQGEQFNTLPFLGDYALLGIARLLHLFPATHLPALLLQAFPFELTVDKTEAEGVYALLTSLGVNVTEKHKESYRLSLVQQLRPGVALLRLACTNGAPISMQVPAGPLVTHRDVKSADNRPYVHTDAHDALLVSALQNYAANRDVCIIGVKGLGKQTIVRRLTELLCAHPVDTIYLYKDMTARDLLQRRITLDNGDTSWHFSPLIRCALLGGVAVLDGVQRISASVFATLQSLIYDREIALFDGTRLVHHERYTTMRAKASEKQLTEKRIFPVHASFRIIALATPPTQKKQWLSSELIAMFPFINITPSLSASKLEVLTRLFPSLPSDFASRLIALEEAIAGCDVSSSVALSLRQLIRLCRRVAAYPEELTGSALHSLIARQCMSVFLPKPERDTIDRLIETSLGARPSTSSTEQELRIETNERSGRKYVRIGVTEAPVAQAAHPALVPRVLFYDIPRHIAALEQLLRDFMLGEHLLLIGNQGVGKNKLVDRLLELLNREREYMQLHRDTTVQSLTVLPALEAGRIVWRDSPLVRAAMHGRVLVLDEADKAPLEVVAVLKGLVEDSEMLLSDGRRITADAAREWESNDVTGAPLPKEEIVRLHPDFRVIALANRPGYPFLGNDLFAECGDVFACHAIENPDSASEYALLRSYGPHVTQDVLFRLIALFNELRSMVDQGLLLYPFSTRELVNIVKHLEAYPKGGVAAAVENVFAFDQYDQQMREHLRTVLQRHGIPVGEQRFTIELSAEKPLPPPVAEPEWWRGEVSRISGSVTQAPLSVKGSWAWKRDHAQELKGRVQGRVQRFDEQLYAWHMPSHSRPRAVASFPDNSLHVLCVDPLELFSYDPLHRSYTITSLSSHFPYYTYGAAGSHALIALPQLNALLAYLPGLFLLFQRGKDVVNVIEIPDKREAALSIYGNNRVFFGTSTLRDAAPMRLSAALAERNIIAMHRPGDAHFALLDLANMTFVRAEFSGLELHELLPLTPTLFFVTNATGQRFLLSLNTSSGHVAVRAIQSSLGNASPAVRPVWASLDGPPHALFSAPVVRLLVTDAPALLRLANGDLTPLPLTVHPRAEPAVTQRTLRMGDLLITVCVDQQDSTDVTSPTAPATQWLEVLDLQRMALRIVQLPTVPAGSAAQQGGASYRSTFFSRVLGIAPLAEGCIAMLHSDGQLRVLQVAPGALARELDAWQQIRGVGEETALTVQITNTDDLTQQPDAMRSGPLPEGPKEGIVDPTGDPHVGGNTFQGGTGGADTPGMGGQGGAYRVNPSGGIVQLAEADKQALSAQVNEARREMAQKALQARLKQIDMSEYEARTYERLVNAVRREITQLRVIFESVEAKEKERVWQKHKSSGDLDDNALVDGVAGDRNIYKYRGEEKPEPGAIQEKPKRLRFVIDLSGSMYRFNGADARLDRTLECVVMITEALKDFEHKYNYSIVGHSGESPETLFVDWNKPPKDEKERYKLVRKMGAHAEYCANGDTTVEAIDKAVERVLEAEGDDYFVFCLSDANLSRYGIKPEALTAAVRKDARVSVYVIFIASLGDSAEQYRQSLPPNRAHICLDTTKLPTIFKQIFTTHMLQQV